MRRTPSRSASSTRAQVVQVWSNYLYVELDDECTLVDTPLMSVPNAEIDEVVLVNHADETLGTMEKLEAHRRGVLHRALSVLITRTDGRLLLQRRSLRKYHSGGLWTNAACTHPGLGEAPLAAAHRRLWDEMGMRCELTPAFAFVYRADVGQGLREHEFDHVFLGVTDQEPRPNADEVDDWRWMDLASVHERARREPQVFTPWFLLLLRELDARDRYATAGGVSRPR